MSLEQKQQTVISLCQRLIQAQSYSGEEKQAANEIADFFREQGFDEVNINEHGCVLGGIHGKRPGPKLLFDGHIDTVPVDDAQLWAYPPFAAEIHDGKIFGRGASDMKGAVAAMACAIANYAKETERNFAGSLYLAGVVHEECFEGVAARAISAAIKPDYVVIGEASELDIKIGQRGRGEIKLEIFGKAAHSANPEKGINAVYHILRVIERIRELTPSEHPVLGKGILELTDIKSSPYPGASVVPSYCMATYDRRLLVGETKETVLEPLQKLLKEMMAQNPELKAQISLARGKERCYTGAVIEAERFFPGWLFDKDEPFIQSVMRELKKAGFSPNIRQYNFCTNGSHYAGEMGIRTIGCGPSREELAHTRDEYIDIEQLFGAVGCYEAIIAGLLSV